MHHGKEIYLFFTRYGINGIIGIVLSQSTIGLIIYKTLTISKISNIQNYTEFLKTINKNAKINETLKIIINIFLLLTFYVMIAGFSAYFSQELGIPTIIGAIIITILCYITFMGNIEGLIKVNQILIPILIAFILIIASKNINTYQNINIKMVNSNFIKSIYSAILYASYNSITIIPIIITLRKYVKSKKEIIITVCIITIILTIIAIAIYGLILNVDIDIEKLELPTVYVVGMNGHLYKILYGGIILVAIFTSAISAGYGLLENYINNSKKYKKTAILICSSSILVSKIGFSTLINVLYPLFGILGMVQIILLIKKKQTP